MWIAVTAAVLVLLIIAWMIWRDLTGRDGGDGQDYGPDNTSGGGGGG